MVQEYVRDEDVKGGTEDIMQQLTEYRLSWSERIAVDARQNILIKLLSAKFKGFTDEVVERIRTIEDESILDDIATQVLFRPIHRNNCAKYVQLARPRADFTQNRQVGVPTERCILFCGLALFKR